MDAEVAPRALSVFPRMTLGSYLMIFALNPRGTSLASVSGAPAASLCV